MNSFGIRFCIAATVASLLAGCASSQMGAAVAQFHPPVAIVSNQGCTGLNNFGNAELCYDSTNALAEYYWNGTAFVAYPASAAGSVGAYSQIGAGNATFGTNSSYGINTPVANESFPTSGKIVHVSCQNITGGTCSGNAPSFEAYVIHGGVETDSSPVNCSATQQSISTGPTTTTVNQAFVANDNVGIKVSTAGSSCNSPSFDADILVCVGTNC